MLIIDIQLTPSNSARLVPSEIGSRLDASNQASVVRLLKCTTRGEREGEGEHNSKKTTVLIGNLIVNGTVTLAGKERDIQMPTYSLKVTTFGISQKCH